MRNIIAAFSDRASAEQATHDLDAANYENTSCLITGESEGGDRLLSDLLARGVPREQADRYAETYRRGGSLVICQAPDERAAEIADMLDAHGSLDLEAASTRWRGEGWQGYRADLAPFDDTERAREREHFTQETLPVVEEQVRIGKRETGGETVRVRTFVTERPVSEQLELHEERIDVRREPADERLAESGEMPFTEEEFVVTARAEQPVVQKEARVVENVVIEKQAGTRTETIEETERRRDVEVERTDAGASPSETERRPRH
jgi:stress response protein YsnF